VRLATPMSSAAVAPWTLLLVRRRPRRRVIGGVVALLVGVVQHGDAGMVNAGEEGAPARQTELPRGTAADFADERHGLDPQS